MEKVESKEKILTINIQGNWIITEFIGFFESLNTLYRLIIEIDNIEYIDVQLSNAKSKIPLTNDYLRVNNYYYKRVKHSNFYTSQFSKYKNPFPEGIDFQSEHLNLYVDKIKFASPGFTDFVGIGKIMEILFEFIKYYFPNKEGKLKRRLMEEDLISKRIENLNKIRYSSLELEKYEAIKNSAVSNITELIYQEKIKSIKLKDKNE